MHCRNGTSPRQISVYILMSLARNYPCNNSAFKHLVQKNLHLRCFFACILVAEVAGKPFYIKETLIPIGLLLAVALTG